VHFHIKINAILRVTDVRTGFFKGADKHISIKTLVLADLFYGFLQFKAHACLPPPLPESLFGGLAGTGLAVSEIQG
jgi:hypothetical protein